MSDFEFSIELLSTLVEARRVLWYKADICIKIEIKKKKVWSEVGWS